MSYQSFLIGLFLIALPALAADPQIRPHCDSKHVGQFWPPPETGSAMAIQDLARSGELQVCARTAEWRYRWERLTITIGQLQESKHKKSDSASARP